ncbi:hypothetical protein GCM10027405_17690 [Arthrobacter alkaliphilus]|uniref:hypothetical protein n=1 Tax=Arthrobacter alkaliphilus TaxID=369936 RepID=UPI001F2C67C0|nr:hypothetical protein [Arthrobacter alkaliphilus]
MQADTKTEAPVRSVTVEASSTHPEDWGRATALALSQLVQEITSATGTDPCREPAGLDVSLHIKAVPGGEAITVTWRGQTADAPRQLPAKDQSEPGLDAPPAVDEEHDHSDHKHDRSNPQQESDGLDGAADDE